MNLTKLAQVAEIISGLAILITLIFLIFEVKENSDVIRASAYTQNIDLLNDWRFEASDNPELTRLFLEYMNGNLADLDKIEATQLNLYIRGLWGIYENAYFSKEYGILGENEWNRFKYQACRQYHTASPQGYWELSRPFFSHEYYSYIETECVEL